MGKKKSVMKAVLPITRSLNSSLNLMRNKTVKQKKTRSSPKSLERATIVIATMAGKSLKPLKVLNKEKTLSFKLENKSVRETLPICTLMHMSKVFWTRLGLLEHLYS